VGDRAPTRAETRYGCFLPDLTGLARSPSGPISQAEYNNPSPIPKGTIRRYCGVLRFSMQPKSPAYAIMPRRNGIEAIFAYIKLSEGF